MNPLLVLLSLIIRWSFPLFIVAFLAGMLCRSQAAKGQVRKARLTARISFVASSLLTVAHLAVGVLGDPTALLMAALWAYFAWRDYQFLKLLA